MATKKKANPKTDPKTDPNTSAPKPRAAKSPPLTFPSGLVIENPDEDLDSVLPDEFPLPNDAGMFTSEFFAAERQRTLNYIQKNNLVPHAHRILDPEEPVPEHAKFFTISSDSREENRTGRWLPQIPGPYFNPANNKVRIFCVPQ